MKLSQVTLLASCAGLCAVSRAQSPSWLNTTLTHLQQANPVSTTPQTGIESLIKRENTTEPKDPMLQLSSDSDFHFEILRVLALAAYEGSDIGEVLVAANKIKAGDFESFYSAFYDLATRTDKKARSIDASKHVVSARNTFFKAASYYRSADFFLHGNWSDPRINSIWAKHLDAFNAAMKLLPIPGKRVTLHAKHDNFTIPATFYSSGHAGPRPTLLLCNGYDGSQEEMFHVIGQAALQRGINVITFEGPGQPTVRREQELGFIHEWEKVVTPVVDYAVTLPEVEKSSIGLLGLSFGGYLAPRAAAFEHRLAAVLAADGIYSFGQSLLNNFPDILKDPFLAGNATQFNYIIEQALKSPEAPTAFKWAVDQGMWSFKVDNPFEWVKRSQEYTMKGLGDKVKAPVYVADAQNDLFFPGQAEELAKELGKKATFRKFLDSEGAGEHCSIGAQTLSNQEMLDWFEGVVGKKNCH